MRRAPVTAPFPHRHRTAPTPPPHHPHPAIDLPPPAPPRRAAAPRRRARLSRRAASRSLPRPTRLSLATLSGRRGAAQASKLREEVSALKAQLKKVKAYENMVNKAVPQNVREGFMDCDKDGSGDISAKELKKALAKIGLKGDNSQAKSVIEKFDTAGSGSLNLVEFQNLVAELSSMSSMGMLGGKAPAPAPAPARSGGLGGYYQGR